MAEVHWVSARCHLAVYPVGVLCVQEAVVGGLPFLGYPYPPAPLHTVLPTGYTADGISSNYPSAPLLLN